MPILPSEIKYYYTGGSSNTNPNTSLGGAISSQEISSGNLHNLFDKVTGDESAAGDIEYRCMAVRNTNATLTWEAVKIFISANTPADDHIEIGVETPTTGAVQVVANESTAPMGITFSSPVSRATGLDARGEGDTATCIGPNKWAAIWLKRIVPAGASAFNLNSVVVVASGDSPA